MEKEVITTQSLNPKTVKKAGKSVIFSQKSRWLLYFGILAFFVIINFVGSYTSGTTPDSHTTVRHQTQNEDFGSDIFTLLMPALIILGAFAIWLLLKKKATKTQFQKKARYFTNVTFTINTSYFRKKGEGFENTYYWEEMYKVKETSQFYLIYSEILHAHVIDKAQLDPWQAEDIKEIFSALEPKIKVSLK